MNKNLLSTSKQVKLLLVSLIILTSFVTRSIYGGLKDEIMDLGLKETTHVSLPAKTNFNITGNESAKHQIFVHNDSSRFLSKKVTDIKSSTFMKKVQASISDAVEKRVDVIASNGKSVTFSYQDKGLYNGNPTANSLIAFDLGDDPYNLPLADQYITSLQESIHAQKHDKGMNQFHVNEWEEFREDWITPNLPYRTVINSTNRKEDILNQNTSVCYRASTTINGHKVYRNVDYKHNNNPENIDDLIEYFVNSHNEVHGISASDIIDEYRKQDILKELDKNIITLQTELAKAVDKSEQDNIDNNLNGITRLFQDSTQNKVEPDRIDDNLDGIDGLFTIDDKKKKQQAQTSSNKSDIEEENNEREGAAELFSEQSKSSIAVMQNTAVAKMHTGNNTLNRVASDIYSSNIASDHITDTAQRQNARIDKTHDVLCKLRILAGSDTISIYQDTLFRDPEFTAGLESILDDQHSGRNDIIRDQGVTFENIKQQFAAAKNKLNIEKDKLSLNDDEENVRNKITSNQHETFENIKQQFAATKHKLNIENATLVNVKHLNYPKNFDLTNNSIIHLDGSDKTMTVNTDIYSSDNTGVVTATGDVLFDAVIGVDKDNNIIAPLHALLINSDSIVKVAPNGVLFTKYIDLYENASFIALAHNTKNTTININGSGALVALNGLCDSAVYVSSNLTYENKIEVSQIYNTGIYIYGGVNELTVVPSDGKKVIDGDIRVLSPKAFLKIDGTHVKYLTLAGLTSSDERSDAPTVRFDKQLFITNSSVYDNNHTKHFHGIYSDNPNSKVIINHNTHAKKLGEESNPIQDLVIMNDRFLCADNFYTTNTLIEENSALRIVNQSAFDSLKLIGENSQVTLLGEIIDPDKASILAIDSNYGNVLIANSDVPTIGSPSIPIKNLRLIGKKDNEVTYLHNDIHADKIKLLSGNYNGTYQSFLGFVDEDINKVFSMNARTIEIANKSNIHFTNLDFRSRSMVIGDDSLVSFHDIKNNVDLIALQQESVVSFVNNKHIKIPEIIALQPNVGEVYIMGGTVNGIGNSNAPVKSVVFLGGENIIDGNVYAQLVVLHDTSIESSNDDVVIYSADGFIYAILPANWYLSNDGTILTPRNKMTIREVPYSIAKNNPATTTAYTENSIEEDQEHDDKIYDSREAVHALYEELDPTATKSEYSDRAKSEARSIIENAKGSVRDYASAAEYGDAIIRDNNLSANDFEAYRANAYDDYKTSSISPEQKKTLVAIAIACDMQDGNDVNKSPNIKGVDVLNGVNHVVTNTINSRIDAEGIELSAINSKEEGVSSGDDDLKHSYGLWIKGVYSKAKQGQTKKQAAYNSNAYGAVIGADVELEDLMVLGAVYSPMKTDLKYAKHNKGEKLNADSHILSLYMHNYLNDKMSIKTVISGGATDIKSKRKIGNRATATGKMPSRFYSAQTAIYYNIACEEVNLIPQVGLKYSSFHDSSLKEKGAGLFNINMKGKNYDELSAIGGLKAALRPHKIGKSIILNSSIHAYVEQILKSAKYTKQAKFVWTDDYFNNEVGDKNKRNYNLGANLGVAYKNMELSTGYNLYLRRKYTEHQVSIKLNVKL